MSSNCIFCLRCDLHDLSVDMIPNAFSWTHEPPRCMHALSLESCWIHTLRFRLLKVGALLSSSFARHCRLHWNFQISPCVFDGLLIFRIFGIDGNKYLPAFEHYRALVSRLTTLALLSSEWLFPFWTKLQATSSQVWWLPLEVFLSIK